MAAANIPQYLPSRFEDNCRESKITLTLTEFGAVDLKQLNFVAGSANVTATTGITNCNRPLNLPKCFPATCRKTKTINFKLNNGYLSLQIHRQLWMLEVAEVLTKNLARRCWWHWLFRLAFQLQKCFFKLLYLFIKLFTANTLLLLVLNYN